MARTNPSSFVVRLHPFPKPVYHIATRRTTGVARAPAGLPHRRQNRAAATLAARQFAWAQIVRPGGGGRRTGGVRAGA